jgi:hypothetical protein
VSRLIIAEGLPCSGKSTTARYIAEKLGYTFVDEGTGDHPADYESHAFLTVDDMTEFSRPEQRQILSAAENRCGGFVVSLSQFSGELFDKLLRHKVYDFLPWETERPVMLDKWRRFTENCGGSCVFNCVILQNPMCETMMRFGFSTDVSAAYIGEICDIIEPLQPTVVYLKNTDIRSSIEAALAERGDEWLSAVIDYHCCGAYGRQHSLSGFDGYISALEERQRRELTILAGLDIDSIVITDPQRDWTSAYATIISKLNEVRK